MDISSNALLNINDYITIKEENNFIALNILSWELYDYIEDILNEEYEISHNGFIDNKTIKPDSYKMIFNDTSLMMKLTEIINKLDLNEVHRIYKINN